MDTLNRETLLAARQWHAEGADVLLATVVRTWGSSPRPVGSMLAVCENGRIRGSVSGGCIEDDLIHQVVNGQLKLDAPRLVTYGVGAEQARQFGLPCGGTLQLVLEPLKQGDWIDSVLQQCDGGGRVARELDINTGQARLRRAGQNDTFHLTGSQLVSVYGPRYRLLIIGAGDLSLFLASMALKLDYDVTVCDPRKEYTHGLDIVGVRTVSTMPDDTVIEMKPDCHTAVVTLTHDPKLDDLALMEALRTDAFYVGAIGSRANNDARRERLLMFDVTPEELTKLRGPVGIYIGSKTPFEIAVSVIAEMTAVKNGVSLPGSYSIANAKKDTETQVCPLLMGAMQP